MAFISDSNDPSGGQMYSKAGRFTTEKWMIFQRKDEILHNKKRVLKLTSAPYMDREKDKNKNMDQDQNKIVAEKIDSIYKKKEQEKKNEEKINPKNLENQPFYKQISREKVALTKQVKNPPKPVGYYRPRFTEIDKAVHLVWNIKDVYEKKRTIPKQAVQRSYQENIDEEEYDGQPKIQAGLVELDRQLCRNPNFLINQKSNPHEERFNYLKMSQTWSNFKKPVGFNMEGKIGREDNKMYNNKQFAPDYHPNYEFGRRQLGTEGGARRWGKIPMRVHKHFVSDTNNEDFYDYEWYVKQTGSAIFRQTSSPNFQKMLSREKSPESPLPSFMQKNVQTRMQIQSLHMKMLEENRFFDGRFQSVTSAFNSPSKNHKKKGDSDNDSDDDK